MTHVTDRPPKDRVMLKSAQASCQNFTLSGGIDAPKTVAIETALSVTMGAASYLKVTGTGVVPVVDAPELSRAARRAIGDSRYALFVSAASVWEIAIKTRRGRLTGTGEYLSRHRGLHEGWGFSTVVMETTDAVSAGLLPITHDDPFDRMLIVQANRLECPIVACDEPLRRHATKTLW